MINDPNGTLHNLLMSSVDMLREPAGKKYQTMEDIRRNHEEFMKDFYAGLYLIHIITTQAIIDAEDKMQIHSGLSSRQIGESKKGWNRIRQLFRCINDSIVWLAIHHEPSFFIRRICRWQPRGKLRDQNYESIMKALQHFAASGRILPIWNDATRCLDISDITLFSPEGISFLELKTGKVNEEIYDMMRKTNRDEILNELDTFFEKYGPKGMAQIDRIIRQEDTAGKLIELSKNDDVFDPFLKVERKAITPQQPLESYDLELSSLLKELRTRDFIAHSIDGCLHILALNRQRGLSVKKGRELIKRYLHNKMERSLSNEVDCRNVILSLESSFDYPTAMPVMLRPWASEDIARISLGQIEIYFGFDVNAWARFLKSARLVWSSKRLGRRELSKAPTQRLFVVQDRIPQVVGQKGGKIILGTQSLQLMLCEGICPSSLAANYDQMADS